MNATSLHDEIRRTAAGLMAILDIERAGEQLVRLYGEEAVADALTPVAEAIRAGAPRPAVGVAPSVGDSDLTAGSPPRSRRKAADHGPRSRTGLLALSRPWTPTDRGPKGTLRQDWL